MLQPFQSQSRWILTHFNTAGGMFDTRNPEPVKHEDARKSISEAPSFEEYMKMRSGGAPAAPAPAPAAYTPPAAPAWAPPAAPAWAPPAAPAWAPPAAPAWAPPAQAPAPWSPPAAAPAAHGGAPIKGAGGMFDTRDPEPVKHEDPRKSITAAPSFEEYMKMRNNQ